MRKTKAKKREKKNWKHKAIKKNREKEEKTSQQLTEEMKIVLARAIFLWQMN